ncbi:hypothetical protein LMA04_20490 [Pseudescherichia vulneris]|uniref:hypothetical protein n=1 Tax=Pseudescherichia vulneris TaxID=566 RepID=UPI00227CECF1|nr:hypothetical protein [Pseudescherichia vulneris]WAH52417.1 hypothetical protein LMA04_20490 [Pseudescherichia vulneris]
MTQQTCKMIADLLHVGKKETTLPNEIDEIFIKSLNFANISRNGAIPYDGIINEYL